MFGIVLISTRLMCYFSCLFMMAVACGLRILSLNCHGFNIGTAHYLNRVAKEVDFIFLQETWLCDATACRLTDSMDSFVVVHQSAMEHKLSSGIHKGRPFGGTAVLVHKSLSKFTHHLITDNPRVTAVRYHPKEGNDLVISSVYMPFDDGSTEHCCVFEEVVGVMQGLLDRHLGCKFIFGGDFNVSKSSDVAVCHTLDRFCFANGLAWLDPLPDGPNYTYHNDTLMNYSAIDHFISSPELLSPQQFVHVLDDGDNLSDHLAIQCSFHSSYNTTSSEKYQPTKLLWDKADIGYYQSVLGFNLSTIALPVDALLCTNIDCQLHRDVIETYYNQVIGCLLTSGQQCVPSIRVGIQKPWWSPDLDTLKQQCIDITDVWKNIGKPRSGEINSERLKCKYRYKQAIKEAIQEEHRSFNEGLLDSLHNADSSSFWRMWRKRYCSKNVTATSVLNGKYGDSNILSEFTDFYKNVAQPNSPCVDSKLSQDVKALLDVRLNDHTNDVPVVALGDIEQCIMNLKHNKAGGYDGVVNEHLIFSDHHLRVHLSLLFTAMLRHSFVPDDFCKGIIVPLLKSKLFGLAWVRTGRTGRMAVGASRGLE